MWLQDTVTKGIVQCGVTNMAESKDQPERFRVETDEAYLRLESRVYSLEKELAFVSNLLVLGCIVAVYFGVKWYQENYGYDLPGVKT